MELSGKPIFNNLKPFQGRFDFFHNRSANFLVLLHFRTPLGLGLGLR